MSRLYLIVMIARTQDSFVKVYMFTRKNNNNNIKARMDEITHILNNALFSSDTDCIALMDEWYRLFYQSQPKEGNNALWYALWQDEEWRAKKIAQLRRPRKR